MARHVGMVACLSVCLLPLLLQSRLPLFHLPHPASPRLSARYIVSAHAMNNGGPTALIIDRGDWTADMDFVGHKKVRMARGAGWRGLRGSVS